LEEQVVKITVNKNGSLRIEGEFIIYDAEGNAFDLGGRTSIGLCRCGHSGSKPFCDGTHRKVEFQSEVKAHALPVPSPKPPAA
jgi:CDGSH-type Zn-finger protein